MAMSKECQAIVDELIANRMKDLWEDPDAFWAQIEQTVQDQKTPFELPEKYADSLTYHLEECHSKAGNLYYIVYPQHGTATDDTNVLYYHGGGLILDANEPAFNMAQRLADCASCKVYMPIYPLVPVVTYKELNEYLLDTYQDILTKIDVSTLVITGDSAGALLTMTMTQLALLEGLPLPRRVIPLSPWLDATEDVRGREEIALHDPLLANYGLSSIVPNLYAPNMPDKRQFPPSPLHGPIKGLPPVHLLVGSNEMFLADCEKFVARAKEEDVEVELTVYPEIFHCWFDIAVDSPEGQAAWKQITELVCRK